MKKVSKAKSFYDDVNEYHEKTYPILRLIMDYFSSVQRDYQKRYVSFRLEQNRVVEKMDDNVTESEVERINVWASKDDVLKNKDEVESSIYKIEFKKSIFFFKIFNYGHKESVLAGYALNDGAGVRNFLSSMNEEKMRRTYERILSLI